MTKHATSGDQASWALILLLAVTLALGQLHAPLAIAPGSLTTLLIACAALGAVAFFYCHVRRQDQFSAMCVALIQVLLFSALGAVLSYLVARGEAPLWDATLARWDRALGLEWLTFVRWMDGHSLAIAAFRLAYASLIPQIIVLVVVLGSTQRIDQLRSVMFASILCGTIAVALSGFFPAVGNFVHMGLSSADFRHLDPWAGTAHMAHLNALRDGSLAVVRLDELQGIITFPSYHAGLSTVTLWGFWLARVPYIRWPGMALAAATIVATPLDGGHYFVDVFAGMAIAVASIAVAVRAVRWSPGWPRLTASPFRRSRAASAP